MRAWPMEVLPPLLPPLPPPGPHRLPQPARSGATTRRCCGTSAHWLNQRCAFRLTPPPALPAAWHAPRLMHSPPVELMHSPLPPLLSLPQASSGPTLPPYEQLKYRAAAAVKLGGASGAAQPLVVLNSGERSHFDHLLRNFQLSGAVKDQALALYVNSRVSLGSRSACSTRRLLHGVLGGTAALLSNSPALCPAAAASLLAPAAALLPAAVRRGGAQVSRVAAGWHGWAAAGCTHRPAGALPLLMWQ